MELGRKIPPLDDQIHKIFRPIFDSGMNFPDSPTITIFSNDFHFFFNKLSLCENDEKIIENRQIFEIQSF